MIATSRYANRDTVVGSGLAPVGTTFARAKFPLGYELAETVGMLAPWGCLVSMIGMSSLPASHAQT